jgi:hypothetical protein
MIDLTIKATLLTHLLKELNGPEILNLSYVVKDTADDHHEFYSSPLPVKELEAKLKHLTHWQASSKIIIKQVTVDLVSRGRK